MNDLVPKPDANGLAADGVTPLWQDGPWNDPGVHPWARGKDWDLRRLYGLHWDWWIDLLEAQGGRCPGCRRTFRFTWECPPGYPRPPHVDHDHDTGEVRGLLCGRCNRKLSQRLTRYVKNPPARAVGPFVVPRKQRQYGAEVFANRERSRLLTRALQELEWVLEDPTPDLDRLRAMTRQGA